MKTKFEVETSLVDRLRVAAKNVEGARNHASTGHLAGWEHHTMLEAVDAIEALNDDMASLKRTLDRIPPSWARAIADENDGPREQRLLNLLGWAARRLPQPYRDYLSREVPDLVIDA